MVLIDDDSLDPQKGAWPVPYRTHARWLRNIGLIHKPRAIFLDITFGRERDDPTLPELVSALCELRDAGVPVFLAALPGDDGGLRLRDGLATPPGEPPCFTMVDVRYAASKVDRLVWSYPLWSEGGTRSAALAMAQDAAGIPLTRGGEAMALTWGWTTWTSGVSRPTAARRAAAIRKCCRATCAGCSMGPRRTSRSAPTRAR
ncbi:CHASE2 domain-containing protein [Achromobacter insuavis]